MAAPKLAKDIEGETPEQVAWALLEWIGMVEDVRTRTSILDTYATSLAAASAGAGIIGGEVGPVAATGTQLRVAYKLAHLVAEMEGRDPGQRNQGDRAWVMGIYTESLEAVLGRRRVNPVVSTAEPQVSEGEVEAIAAA